MATPSFWHLNTPQRSDTEQFDGDVTADVLIIGGGFTGLSVARELKQAQPNLRIVICEQNFVGFGASGRNTGYCNYSCVYNNPVELIQSLGVEKAKAVSRHAQAAVQHVRSLIREHDIPCDWEESGLAYAAVTDRQNKFANKLANAAKILDIPGTLWDADECKAKLGSDVFVGAWVDSGGCNLDPYKLARGILDKVVLPLGVRVFEHATVRKVRDSGSSVEALVNGHKVTVGTVVYATNAYCTAYPLRYHFAPIHVYSIVTEPLTDTQMESIGNWPGRTGVYTLHHILDAIRLSSDNRLIIATGNIRMYRGDQVHVPAAEEYERLRRTIGLYFPSLKDLRVHHGWEGVIAMNLTDQASIGRSGNIYHSIAYCGHGVALSNFSGRIVADLFCNRYTDRMVLPFLKAPFPLIPGSPLRNVLDVTYINALRYLDRRADAEVGRRLGVPFVNVRALTPATPLDVLLLALTVAIALLTVYAVVTGASTLWALSAPRRG